MEVEFAHHDLDRLETDPGLTKGLPPAVVRVFRRRMQAIRAAVDERAFYALKSLHFEKLEGQRQHQHSMRINDQFRLIVELKGIAPDKRVIIVDIEDYH